VESVPQTEPPDCLSQHCTVGRSGTDSRILLYEAGKSLLTFRKNILPFFFASKSKPTIQTPWATSSSTYFSPLKMDTVRFSETLVDLYQTVTSQNIVGRLFTVAFIIVSSYPYAFSSSLAPQGDQLDHILRLLHFLPLRILISNASGFVLTAVTMNSTIVWHVTPCSPIVVRGRFGGTYCLHLQV
jgi:hypothetical protein